MNYITNQYKFQVDKRENIYKFEKIYKNGKKR